LFPPADTPDVDLEPAGGTNVTGGETFATAGRIQLDSTSRAAITSAGDRVGGRSDRIVIVRVYSCAGMGKTALGGVP